MTWKEAQDFFRGKLVLIGINFVEKEGELIESYQTHGRVLELTGDAIFKINKSNNSLFQMPYDLESIEQAEKGEYREKTTGLIIKDPDFILTFDIVVKKDENLDGLKELGYIP